MTGEIALVLGILAVAVVLFVTGWVRMDLVALVVLASLALTGILTPPEALAGFSNPAVITIAGMFVISAALARTGVAAFLGREVLRLGRGGERRLLLVMMATAGLMSAFMNNVAVVAMMLPVTMEVSRRTGIAPSRLLIPLALAAHLGGLTTLIGTAPNLLVADALLDEGLRPFHLFEFAPLGGALLIGGIAFVVLLAPRLLPARDPKREIPAERELRQAMGLEERLFFIRVPERSVLDGRSLRDSKLGSTLGLHVLAIMREGRQRLDPGPEVVLRGGDRLLVQGRPDLLEALRGRRHLAPVHDPGTSARLVTAGVGVGQIRISPGASLVGRTLNETDFRNERGVVVLAYRREGESHRTHLQDVPLAAGDELLVQGPHDRLAELEEDRDFEALELLSPEQVVERFRIDEHFLSLRITDDSILVGRTLADSRLGDAAGLTVLGIVRDGETTLVPAPDEAFQAGDVLLVKARGDDLAILRGLQRLEVDDRTTPRLDELESDHLGLMEVVLAPRTSLLGKTLRQAHFRERYGVNVLAIWREGKALRSDLRDRVLQFGDGLLLYGPRNQLRLLAEEPSFIVLSGPVREAPRVRLAPLSLLILLAALVPVAIGWLSIEIAVVAGSALMVLTRCLPVEQAYRSVEWSSLILIAGMIPLGMAMDRTGAAALLADGVVGTMGTLGPRGVLAGLALMTAVGVLVIPTSALVVLMAPIALSTAADLGISPHALLMGIALSAASLTSPVSHPANALIMGAGGYRFVDFMRVGAPLTALVLLLVVLIVPIFFPL